VPVRLAVFGLTAGQQTVNPVLAPLTRESSGSASW